MSYKADLEIQDTINGTMGVGVDYYKGDRGNDGYTPVKGKDYFTQEEIEKIEQDTIKKINTDDFVKSADLANVATSGSYKDLIDKPEPIDLTPYPTKNEVEQTYAKKTDIPDTTNLATKSEVQQVEDKIPAPYTLPKATTSTLGGVMPDGNTITIADGVISAVGSGGGEPSAYIKDASVSGNTLTLTKKDNTNVVFTPSGSGGGGSSYILPTASQFNLGGVKVGAYNTIYNQKQGVYALLDKDKLLYIPVAGAGFASSDTPGVIRLRYSRDNGLRYDTDTGYLSADLANDTTTGTIRLDGTTIKSKGDNVGTVYVPTATSSDIGLVKPDGTTVNIDKNGVISVPVKEVVNSAIASNTDIKIYKNITIPFDPTGNEWIVDYVKNSNKYIITVNGGYVFKVDKYEKYKYLNFTYVEYTGGNLGQGSYAIYFTDSTFTKLDKNYNYYNNTPNILLTDNNYKNYINISGNSSWQYTQDNYDSNLYNAKELVVYVENTQGNRQMGYFNFGANGNLGNLNGYNFYFDYNTSSPYIYYNGSGLEYGNANNVYYIYYKT